MTVAELTLATAAQRMREAVKDRSYRATPLGLEVARYIRWKRNEWGAAQSTIRDYEPHLRNICVYFADLELADFQPPIGTERLREVMNHYWGDAAGRTRNKVRSTWVDFFEWAINEHRGIYGNPARAIARAKVRDTPKELLTDALIERVLAANPYEADQCGLMLIVRFAIRRSGLANVQMKHFDFDRKLLTVHTKGGRIHPLPLPDPIFWRKLGALKTQGLGDDSYLLYRRDSRKRIVELEQAEEVLTLAGGKQQGYAWLTTRHHDLAKPLAGNSVHRWWYRCLETAGLVPVGTTAGLNMHRGRHTSITAVVRGSHNLKLAQDLAGHVDIGSTAGYSHLDTADLADALTRIYNFGADE